MSHTSHLAEAVTRCGSLQDLDQGKDVLEAQARSIHLIKVCHADFLPGVLSSAQRTLLCALIGEVGCSPASSRKTILR